MFLKATKTHLRILILPVENQSQSIKIGKKQGLSFLAKTLILSYGRDDTI